LINDQYGTSKGDEVLKHIARVYDEGFTKMGGVCCRIATDNFAALYPATFMNSKEVESICDNAARSTLLLSPLAISTGQYIVTDKKLPVSTMFDHATLAAETVKGRFDVHTATYDESMMERILHEQEIVNEMVSALITNQFEVWFQPQYNHNTGALIGSEALVRWRHPVKGLIPPGEFIPIFEQNGFVYEMDKFVWERACMLLRKWLDEGRSPIPISVNISRYDIFRDDFYAVITGLVKQYDISVDLLHLEITESAFAESAKQIVSMVKRLVSFGFTVQIDDFGSGYSSLNTLKSVPANVLKLDMRFLEDDKGTTRGGNIVESIIRMAKWLGMPVIAEGVETQQQADFLKSIGCYYVQGYLYSKPMPLDDYARLVDASGKEHSMIKLETIKDLNNNAFWDPKSMETLIFNSYIGGACIFEFCNGKAELLRANEKYTKELCGEILQENAELSSLRIESYVDEYNLKILHENVSRSIEANDESSCEVRLHGVNGRDEDGYIYVTVRPIAVAGERFLIYCTIHNMTDLRNTELRERETAEQLEAIMRDMPGGFVRMRVLSDEASVLVYANEGFCRLVGMPHDEVMAKYAEDGMWGVHPEDRQIVRDAIDEMLSTGETFSSRYRLRHGSGGYVWVTFFGRFVTNNNGEKFFNL
ncbi:MAG: EAL domain-containing protein, partial [Synergistaceae bacterium]|nr:EAL domain-containing protein [Synergistaceae bacterium]